MAKSDPDYFKKNNKFSKDITFIFDFIQDKTSLYRFPEKLLQDKDLIINLSYKIPNLIPYLSVELKGVYNKYQEPFLERCYSSENKELITFSLSIYSFAAKTLSKDPKYYQLTDYS